MCLLRDLRLMETEIIDHHCCISCDNSFHCYPDAAEHCEDGHESAVAFA